jgi:flagellar biosynthetic protein FliR
VPVDLFAAGVPQALVLLALRVGGLLLVAPAFSAKSVPVKVRTGHAAALHAAASPGRRGRGAPPAAGAPGHAGGVPRESLVGFALGFGAAVLVGAVETAGDLMSTTVGLSGASLLDPLNGASSTVLAQFAQLFAVTVLLSVGGHVVMLDALAESVRASRSGARSTSAAGSPALGRAGARLFVLGLKFAAPVIAATMIGNVALAVLTRVAPALNLFTVAFPVQIGLGLAAGLAMLGAIATWFTGWSGHYAETIGRFFAAFGS